MIADIIMRIDKGEYAMSPLYRTHRDEMITGQLLHVGGPITPLHSASSYFRSMLRGSLNKYFQCKMRRI